MSSYQIKPGVRQMRSVHLYSLGQLVAGYVDGKVVRLTGRSQRFGFDGCEERSDWRMSTRPTGRGVERSTGWVCDLSSATLWKVELQITVDYERVRSETFENRIVRVVTIHGFWLVKSRSMVVKSCARAHIPSQAMQRPVCNEDM